MPRVRDRLAGSNDPNPDTPEERAIARRAQIVKKAKDDNLFALRNLAARSLAYRSMPGRERDLEIVRGRQDRLLDEYSAIRRATA